MNREDPVKLELRSRGIAVDRTLTEHVEKRLRGALGRFAHRVERVRVQLVDLNGPKGGEDIRCHIQARLAPRGTLVIEETRADPFAAVARASARIRGALVRRLGRLRARRRGRA